MNNINIDIEPSDISEKIAGYASQIMNLTSEANLTTAANNLHAAVDALFDKIAGQPTKVANLINDELLLLLENSGAMDAIYKSLNATEDIVNLLKKSLDICNTATTASANISDIIGTKVDGHCIPSVKDITSAQFASAKTKLEEAWNDAKLKTLTYYNLLIVSGCDATLDNVTLSISNILNFVEPYLDPTLDKYTGYTIAEAKYKAAIGIQYVQMFKRVCEAIRALKVADKAKDEADELAKTMSNAIKDNVDNAISNSVETIEDYKDQLEDTYDNYKSQIIEIESAAQDTAKYTAAELKAAALLQVADMKSDLSKEEIKVRLMEWLSKQNILLQNAFQIIIIKLQIDDVKYICEDLGNMSIEHMADMVNAINDVFAIFETLGFYPDAQGYSFQDIYDLGLAINEAAVDTANSVKDQTKDIYNNTKDNIKVAASSTQSKVSSIYSQDSITDTIHNSGNATQNSVKAVIDVLKTFDGDIHHLALDIDTSKIEAITNGKVMMLEPVIQLLKVLQPVILVLSILCHLLENYNINKQTVENKARINLGDAMRAAYNTALGLKEILSLDNLNFYTVRTEELANWCKRSFKNLLINEANMAQLNIAQTIKLNTHLAIIKSTDVLDTLKPTTLYFDNYGIAAGNEEDGTFNNLNNIIVNTQTNEIYYDAKNRSTFASEILEAINKKVDPKEIDSIEVNLEIEIDPLDQLMNAITIESNEMDGTLVINLSDMNLCYSEAEEDTPIDKESSKVSHAIIEFGQEYTNGDKVDYTLNVKPGDTINKDTIIGYATIGGHLQAIRSIFNKGTIKSTSDNLDYYHVYPSYAKNHIVVEDYEIGQGNDYDVEAVLDLANKFSDSAQLAGLILNDMNKSVLPVILYNRNSNNDEDSELQISGVEKNAIARYDEYQSRVSDILEKYGDDISTASSEKTIKATNGSPSKIADAGNTIIDLRASLINDLIDLYTTKLSNDFKCKGESDYSDCALLAYGNVDNKKDFNDDYCNYYINLLQQLKKCSETKYTKQYANILQTIVDRRLTKEGYNLGSLMTEFNTLYNKHINNTPDNPYEMIHEMFTDKLPTYSEIYEYLKRQYIYVKSSNKAKNDLHDNNDTQWYELQEEEITNGKDTHVMYGICKLLANIFMYIKTESPTQIPTTISETSPLKQLEDARYVYCEVFKEFISTTFDDPVGESIKQYNSIAKSSRTKVQLKTTYKNWLKSLNDKLTNKMAENMYDTITYIKQTIEDTDNTTLLTNATCNNFVLNMMAWTLVKLEYEELTTFWNSMIELYNTSLNMESLISEMKSYANKLLENAEWPLPTNIIILGATYKLYVFANNKEPDKEHVDDIGQIPETIEPPTDLTLDIDELEATPANIREHSNITYFDYEYWAVYMANATLLTAIPIYWAAADMPSPTGIILMPLPALYFPIAKPIAIKPINVLLVFGLAIRGIDIFPIVITLNMSGQPINALLPALIALLKANDIYQTSMEYIENGIPEFINGYINKLCENNTELQKVQNKFRTYASLIASIPIEDKARIEQEFKNAVYGDKQDKRQVITRLEKLGEGPDPM